MLRTLAAAGTIGVRAILVHAIVDDARNFYLRYGFEASPTDRLHLMILVKDVAASVNVGGAEVRLPFVRDGMNLTVRVVPATCRTTRTRHPRCHDICTARHRRRPLRRIR